MSEDFTQETFDRGFKQASGQATLEEAIGPAEGVVPVTSETTPSVPPPDEKETEAVPAEDEDEESTDEADEAVETDEPKSE